MDTQTHLHAFIQVEKHRQADRQAIWQTDRLVGMKTDRHKNRKAKGHNKQLKSKHIEIHIGRQKY